jgi:hypothetical protein
MEAECVSGLLPCSRVSMPHDAQGLTPAAHARRPLTVCRISSIVARPSAGAAAVRQLTPSTDFVSPARSPGVLRRSPRPLLVAMKVRCRRHGSGDGFTIAQFAVVRPSCPWLIAKGRNHALRFGACGCDALCVETEPEHHREEDVWRHLLEAQRQYALWCRSAATCSESGQPWKRKLLPDLEHPEWI